MSPNPNRPADPNDVTTTVPFGPQGANSTAPDPRASATPMAPQFQSATPAAAPQVPLPAIGDVAAPAGYATVMIGGQIADLDTDGRIVSGFRGMGSEAQ